MDQIKIGAFLKALRREKNLTQEELAEELNVSSKTVSRWETGRNLPDISLLVCLAEFYHVSIPEIIDGERKIDVMRQETKETAVKMAEYSKKESAAKKQKTAGVMLAAFGVFIIISALGIFPADSSWGGIYSILGGVFLIAGLAVLLRSTMLKRRIRILACVICAVILAGAFAVSDYIAVTRFNQVPRFSYEKEWSSEHPDQVIYKTLFFTAVQKHRDTAQEKVEIVK